MAMFTERPEDAHKSREWQVENALYWSLQCLQQIQIAANMGDVKHLKEWHDRAGVILAHWLENIDDYMQAPEWNEPAQACRDFLKQKYGDKPLSHDDGMQFSHPDSGAPILTNDAITSEGDPRPNAGQAMGVQE